MSLDCNSLIFNIPIGQTVTLVFMRYYKTLEWTIYLSASDCVSHTCNKIEV